jgi:hypothetical protein
MLRRMTLEHANELCRICVILSTSIQVLRSGCIEGRVYYGCYAHTTRSWLTIQWCQVQCDTKTLKARSCWECGCAVRVDHDACRQHSMRNKAQIVTLEGVSAGACSSTVNTTMTR